ncbi:hypothetical protein ID1017_02020 [Helicobacter pylori]
MEFFQFKLSKIPTKKAVDKSLNTIRDNLTKNIESQLEYAKKDAFEKLKNLKLFLTDRLMVTNA